LAGAWRARPAGADLRAHRHAHLRGVDGDHRHLQLAPHARARHREVRHAGAEGALAAEARKRRAARRARLTEPDAGTDLQGIRMTARRDGDAYVIDGTKTWISNGVEGSVFALLVKTDPRAEPRHRGMSLFIAQKGPGFSVGRKLAKLGYKSIDSAELRFDGYRVPADQLIGGAEGQGFYQATGGLLLGRINVAARGVGVAEAALELAARYAQERKTFGKPICEH